GQSSLLNACAGNAGPGQSGSLNACPRDAGACQTGILDAGAGNAGAGQSSVLNASAGDASAEQTCSLLTGPREALLRKPKRRLRRDRTEALNRLSICGREGKTAQSQTVLKDLQEWPETQDSWCGHGHLQGRHDHARANQERDPPHSPGGSSAFSLIDQSGWIA